jgi:3-deoxy-manno-octulosonate cytidylyltransferase (CMP-KDO synthetase)
MVTVACPLFTEAVNDPNAVKVICDQGGFALYFSRSPIPYYREQNIAPVFHHLGLYAFRRDFLKVYAALSPTPLEKCEQLEQLRALEHGYRIRVVNAESMVVEVNTPLDMPKAEAALLGNG